LYGARVRGSVIGVPECAKPQRVTSHRNAAPQTVACPGHARSPHAAASGLAVYSAVQQLKTRTALAHSMGFDRISDQRIGRLKGTSMDRSSHRGGQVGDSAIEDLMAKASPPLSGPERPAPARSRPAAHGEREAARAGPGRELPLVPFFQDKCGDDPRRSDGASRGL